MKKLVCQSCFFLVGNRNVIVCPICGSEHVENTYSPKFNENVLDYDDLEAAVIRDNKAVALANERDRLDAMELEEEYLKQEQAAIDYEIDNYNKAMESIKSFKE